MGCTDGPWVSAARQYPGQGHETYFIRTQPLLPTAYLASHLDVTGIFSVRRPKGSSGCKGPLPAPRPLSWSSTHTLGLGNGSPSHSSQKTSSRP